MIRAALLSLLIAVTASLPARAEQQLVADLDTHQIAIRSTFTGTDLLLFGAIEAVPGKGLSAQSRGDVILVVRGPDDDVTVRKKNRVGPIWANTESATFKKVPGFYALITTRALPDIVSDAVIRRHELGIETVLAASPVKAPSDEAAELEDFRQALIRNRTNEDLFQVDSTGFRFVGGKLFRARISLPANVPVGTYRVEAFLVRDGQVTSAQFSPLFVDKVGLELQIFRFAHHYEWLYGILSVLLAAAAGYVATLIFREN